MLSSVASILTSAALQANLIKREEANNYYQELSRKVPSNYVSDEDMSILNVPQAVLSNQYVQMAPRNVERSEELAKAWGTDKGIFFDIAVMSPSTGVSRTSPHSPTSKRQPLPPCPPHTAKC